MQISTAFGSFAEVEFALPEEGATTQKEFQRLDGATGDVSDAFYSSVLSTWQYGLASMTRFSLTRSGSKLRMRRCSIALLARPRAGLGHCSSARAQFSGAASEPWDLVVLSSTGVLPQICETARSAKATATIS